MAIDIGSGGRGDGTRRTKRYGIDLTKRIFCDFYEKACSTDAIMEAHIFKYHGKKKGSLHMIKSILLTIGDEYEAGIAKRRAANAPYR